MLAYTSAPGARCKINYVGIYIFINVLCLYKRQILMLHFGVRSHENVEHSKRREKCYNKGSKPCSRAFTTIGKQTTNHAE